MVVAQIQTSTFLLYISDFNYVKCWVELSS